MTKKIEYIEIEGIKCEVKNKSKRKVVEYYQNNLSEEIDKYISSVDRWTESKRSYRDRLEVNVIIAPFVLGWLRKPEDNDEYLLIKGHITADELKAKRSKENKKNKKTTSKKFVKKHATKKFITNKPVASKKSDSTQKKAGTKKVAPNTSKK